MISVAVAVGLTLQVLSRVFFGYSISVDEVFFVILFASLLKSIKVGIDAVCILLFYSSNIHFGSHHRLILECLYLSHSCRRVDRHPALTLLALRDVYSLVP